MSKTQTCPVDGCDYQGDVDAIKGHMGASTDHPNWSDLDDQVREDLRSGDGETSDGGDDQVNDQGNDPPEGGGSDPSGDDDQGDQDVDQDEPGQNDQNDHPENDPMPTSEELARQRDQLDQGDDQDDADDPNPSDSGPSTPIEPSGGGIPIPVSTTTLAMGAALVLMAGLLYLYARDSSSENDPVETSDDEGSEPEVPTGDGGGLMGEDPTGGA